MPMHISCAAAHMVYSHAEHVDSQALLHIKIIFHSCMKHVSSVYSHKVVLNKTAIHRQITKLWTQEVFVRRNI
jgi:hypothetical protein